MSTDNWTPNPYFKWPHAAPTRSEERRLFPFALNMFLARRRTSGPVRYNYRTGHDEPAAVFTVRDGFRHTLRQWWFLGLAQGKGNRAERRARALRVASGPWLNWPQMTITRS